MAISGSFSEIPQEPIKIDVHEPDVPKFRFPEPGRTEMKEKEGLTEEEIVASEIVATNKIIASKRSREMRAVRKDDENIAA